MVTENETHVGMYLSGATTVLEKHDTQRDNGMSYVKRNDDGEITAISLTPYEGFEEQVDIQSEEFLRFLNRDLNASSIIKQALKASDTELVRVTEDLINLLIKKQLILFTELPNSVQHKLMDRENLRKTLQTDQPSIIDDAGSI